MVSRRPFYIVVALLFILGISLMIYRHVAFDVPWLPGEYRQVWSVEAKVEFDAGEQPIIASLAIPATQPGFTLVATGIWPVEKVRDRNADFLPPGVDWVKEMAVAIDPVARSVTTASGRKLPYDFLVVATGLHLDYAQIEGMDVKAIGSNGLASVYHSPQAAEATWRAMQAFAAGAEAASGTATGFGAAGFAAGLGAAGLGAAGSGAARRPTGMLTSVGSSSSSNFAHAGCSSGLLKRPSRTESPLITISATFCCSRMPACTALLTAVIGMVMSCVGSFRDSSRAVTINPVARRTV